MRTFISKTIIISIFVIGGIIITLLGIVGLLARIVRFISSTIQPAISVSIVFIEDKICKLVDKVSA